MFDNRVTGLKHPLLRRLLWQMKSSFLLVGIKDQVGLLGRREGTIPTPSFCLRVEYIHSIVSTCGRLAFQGIRGIGWNWSLTIHWWQSVTQRVRRFNTSFLGWIPSFLDEVISSILLLSSANAWEYMNLLQKALWWVGVSQHQHIMGKELDSLWSTLVVHWLTFPWSRSIPRFHTLLPSHEGLQYRDK